MSNSGYELEWLNFGKHSTSQTHVNRRDVEVMATFEKHPSRMQENAMGKKGKRTGTFCHVNGEVLCSKQQVRECFHRKKELCINEKPALSTRRC